MSPTGPKKILRGITMKGLLKSNLQCQCIYQISISQKTAGKFVENLIFTKDNNSCKSMSSIDETWTWSVLCQCQFIYQISLS